MYAEEIAEELCEIFCENAEEPAGSGCGYGVTEDGQADILAVIKRILPQSERNIMSERIVVVEQLFEVTAIEKTQKLNSAGFLMKEGLTLHAHRQPITATSADAARSKIERSITKGLEDDAADALIDRLEVKVEVINFP